MPKMMMQSDAVLSAIGCCAAHVVACVCCCFPPLLVAALEFVCWIASVPCTALPF